MADKTELPEIRLKRLHMRSWRRGMKEMDLILGHFADEKLGELGAEELDLYERLLSENDQDLYLWVTRRIGAAEGDLGPGDLSPVLGRIASHAALRFGAA